MRAFLQYPLAMAVAVALTAATGCATTTSSTPTQSRPEIAIQPATAGDAFYEALGGKDGVTAIVAEMVRIMLADQRISATFDGVDLDRLNAKLAEQFCVVSGGPCTYTGKGMAEVHEDLKVNNTQFNAVVEDLQLAMERRNVPSRAQNKLLGKLAPTQRSIVTK